MENNKAEKIKKTISELIYLQNIYKLGYNNFLEKRNGVDIKLEDIEVKLSKLYDIDEKTNKYFTSCEKEKSRRNICFNSFLGAGLLYPIHETFENNQIASLSDFVLSYGASFIMFLLLYLHTTKEQRNCIKNVQPLDNSYHINEKEIEKENLSEEKKRLFDLMRLCSFKIDSLDEVIKMKQQNLNTIFNLDNTKDINKILIENFEQFKKLNDDFIPKKEFPNKCFVRKM